MEGPISVSTKEGVDLTSETILIAAFEKMKERPDTYLNGILELLNLVEKGFPPSPKDVA